MEILCVIPARSGSKCIPNKNIVDVAGKPLIAYSIEAALESKYIDRVIVSTDSREYADISIRYGAEVPFLRPEKLADDHVHSVYPVINCLETLKDEEKYNPDIIVMLLPTSPLRMAKHIDESVEIYLEKKSGSVVSVTEATKPPQYIKRINNGLLQPYEEMAEGPNFQRQQLEKLYEGNGSIFITSITSLLEENTFHGQQVYPYIMDKRYSIDINDKFDLEIVRLILEKESSNE